MAMTRCTGSLPALAEHVLSEVYLPRIVSCLRQLSDEQIWWRSNEASNSVGNLVLHLQGNVRQWIVSGLGGAPDVRQREREFAERGPMPRRKLIRHLRKAVDEACAVMRRLSSETLAGSHRIQKFQITGNEAIFHVAEHFSHHAGQIILLTKLLRGRDLKFTRLPGGRKSRTGTLPAL